MFSYRFYYQMSHIHVLICFVKWCAFIEPVPGLELALFVADRWVFCKVLLEAGRQVSLLLAECRCVALAG